MKFLYVGNLRPGDNGPERRDYIRSAGLSAIDFNTQAYLTAGLRVERSLLARFQIGRSVIHLNQALRSVLRTESPDLVWIDKGILIEERTMKALKALPGTFAVHYTPDSQFIDNRSRHFFRSIPHYDLLVTTKPFEVDAYRSHGAREVILVEQGYGARFDHAPDLCPDPALASDVCFIGHCQPHYARLLQQVSALGVDLKIWGPRWPRYARLHTWARPHAMGEGLWGEDYPRALRSTKIALGLLSKRIPETTTTRSFEIPASGVFMLAERTDDHRRLFEEGREAEFFENADEMLAKIQHYLGDQAARNAIATAGRRRSETSGYSTRAQFEAILARVEALKANKTRATSA